MYVSQLVPLSQSLSRIKMKLFGASNVGKTTLVDSMKCGMFSGFFRRSRIASHTSQSAHSITKGTGHFYKKRYLLFAKMYFIYMEHYLVRIM